MKNLEITETTRRIARIGAAKMLTQRYAYEAIAEGLYEVTNPQGKKYLVNSDPVMDDFAPCCTCPFCAGTEDFEGRNYCKHAEWLRNELAEEGRYDAEAATLTEWEEYGRHDLADQAAQEF